MMLFFRDGFFEKTGRRFGSQAGISRGRTLKRETAKSGRMQGQPETEQKPVQKGQANCVQRVGVCGDP